MSERISGIIVATLTPFTPAGTVDAGAIGTHVELLAQGGVAAVAPAGTTGEFLYLSEQERARVVRETAAAAAGRMKVIAGIWAPDAQEVGRLARLAERSGADAVFLTTPIYYPAGDEVVVRWYRSARFHTRLPLFAYHIPQYAVNGVSADALRRLVEEGTIQGIKDSTGSLERIQSLMEFAAGRIAVYGASDSAALAARRLGVDGFISALANIYPRTFSRIWAGDEAAQAAIDRIRAAVKGYGGLSALKTLLRFRGIEFGGTRLPFSELAQGEEEGLRRVVEALGPLD